MARRGRLPKVSIVGAGTVGTALAVFLHRKGFHIVSIISRSDSAARRAARQVHCPSFSQHVHDLHPSTEFLLLATSDEAISPVAQQIARSAPLRFDRLFAAHTSGPLTSDALKPLEQLGATTFSFHPIQSFPAQKPLAARARSMEGIPFGVEGSAKARRFARKLVRRIGGTMIEVPKDEKISYHLACVLASNYTVALLGAVDDIAKRFTRHTPRRYFHTLVLTSMEHAFHLSPSRALTGPIARGSIGILRQHLKAIDRKHRRVKELYRSLGIYALELAKREGRLPPAVANRLKKILSS